MHSRVENEEDSKDYCDNIREACKNIEKAFSDIECVDMVSEEK